MKNSITILILLSVSLRICTSTNLRINNDIFFSKDEDEKLNFVELAYKYATKCQEHDVVTEDGYILKLFRIPGSGKPVFLQHGLQDSADIFIIRGYTSLAFILAAEGYDVWVGNMRGNKYSRRHIRHSPDHDEEFWDFSIHEHGYYDISAMIDYVLQTTGRPKLDYIGHSQGTTIAFILGSTRPEYNQKISFFIALAPVVFLQTVSSHLKKLFQMAPLANHILKKIHKEELGGQNSTETRLLRGMCSIGTACLNLVFDFTGADFDELERSFIPVFFGHYPAGSSRKNLDHFSQIGRSGRFAHYDYGFEMNTKVYGSAMPPEYDLRKMTMPTVLIVGKNDGFSSVEDTKKLVGLLPNVLNFTVMEDPKYNHLDFVVGRSAYKTLYPKILDNLVTLDSELNV